MTEPDELLRLYQFEGCPYCSKVRKKLTELQLDFIARQVEPNGNREQVREISDQRGVPVLVDPNEDVIMPESDDIVDYLEEEYG